MGVAGEMNYEITLLLLDEKITFAEFVTRFQALIDAYMEGHELDYQTQNDITGAIFNALFEYASRKGQGSPREGDVMRIFKDHYRTIVRPYEDIKIAQNGDVYDVK